MAHFIKKYQFLCICIHFVTIQTLVIWSASGRTLGVTLSSILTCSRTSSGILFNRAGLMVLSWRLKNRDRMGKSRQEGNSNSNTLLRNSATFLAMICSKTWFFKNILSPRLEQRTPECVKSHSAGLFQTRFCFATHIKSGKDSRLRLRMDSDTDLSRRL